MAVGPGQDRRAPLFLTSQFSKLASLDCLVRHGADLQTTNEECCGATCLSVAAEQNNAVVIRALAAAGAPLQQAMHDGATPLHLACFNASVEATKGVAKAEANPHPPTHRTFTLTLVPRSRPNPRPTPLGLTSPSLPP